MAYANSPSATLDTTTGTIQVLGRALWCVTGYGMDDPVLISGCKPGDEAQQWKLSRETVTGGKFRGMWLVAQWVHDPALCLSEAGAAGSQVTLVHCLTGDSSGGVARMTEIRGVDNAWQITGGHVKLAVPSAMNADPKGRITSYLVTWRNSTRYRYGWLLPGGWHPLDD